MEAAGEETSETDSPRRHPSRFIPSSARTKTATQEKEEKLQVTFTVIGTADQLIDLESYMKNAQLHYAFQ